MKTKKLIFAGAILIAIAGISFSGCKKDKSDGPNTDTSTLQQLTKDEVAIQGANDDADKDVNDVISKSGGKAGNWVPCNATLDSTSVVNDTITYNITYNGLNCSGTHNRSGQVQVRKNVNTHWKDAGAVVYVKFINLYITKISNGKSVTINGTKKHENVSGGLLADLGSTLTSVVHKVSGSIQATFDDNTTRTWIIARQKTFTGTPGALICTVDGFGSADGKNNLVIWGVNRSGENFYVEITQSIKHKEACGWDPAAGMKIYSIPSDNKSATVTFGFDDNNQPVALSGNCPTRYKVDWIKNTHSGTLYIQL
jgi:hypothetical protein